VGDRLTLGLLDDTRSLVIKIKIKDKKEPLVCLGGNKQTQAAKETYGI
jgi:hypothetical protein